MSANQLATVRQNVARTECYRIGNHKVLPSHKGDFHCICNGLTLWAGILLDHDLRLDPTDHEHLGFAGRLKKLPWLSGDKEVDLTILLTFLDDMDASLLLEISGHTPFKGAHLLKEIRVPASAGVIVDLYRRTIKCMSRGGVSDVIAVKLLHQMFCFLKKIQIDRPDLTEAANAAFIEFESGLELADSIPESSEYTAIVFEMNALARRHLKDFNTDAFRPKHGPGVVADKGVKCWYDKYTHFRTDDRVNYLLGREDLGTSADYCPWIMPEKSTRTSRFVSVAKTWKKLRGISAEPVELMFFQQAISARLDNLFTTDSWWKQRVNLHDQATSRRLALLGSSHNGYATIDLSNASDSVTLKLVKDVFKGTPVLRWLLGTRSTQSLCESVKVKLRKFAPMGSACCFPTECIIFALAAQAASDRTFQADLDSSQTVRIFGDDIIVDWYAAPTLISMLEVLGFSVNTDKTYITGQFREACGVEAYRGSEIQPLRYKRLEFGFGPEPSSPDDIATALEYCNTLYSLGCHETRKYLLQELLSKQHSLGNTLRSVSRYLPATFSGGRGTLASPMPTNFNRLLKFDHDLQTLVVRSIGYRLRLLSKFDNLEMSELFSWMKYHEWQLGHQLGCFESEKRWANGWIELGRVNDFDKRLPLGFAMTPTEKWVVWTHYDSLV